MFIDTVSAQLRKCDSEIKKLEQRMQQANVEIRLHFGKLIDDFPIEIK